MKQRVVVNDRMQTNYVYCRTEPAGKNFAPQFQPQLTPKQMLALGVFGGKYMTDCHAEFPSTWFERAKLSPGRRDARINYFGVNASQSLATWRRNGWIHPQDPRGWFQWYCRYYTGRRTPMMHARSAAGARSRATSPPFGRIASQVISSAAGDSARPCYTGRTTAERSSSAHLMNEAAGVCRPIRIGISSCLLGEAVRFDGGHQRDPFLTRDIRTIREWIFVCSETWKFDDLP